METDVTLEERFVNLYNAMLFLDDYVFMLNEYSLARLRDFFKTDSDIKEYSFECFLIYKAATYIEMMGDCLLRNKYSTGEITRIFGHNLFYIFNGLDVKDQRTIMESFFDKDLYPLLSERKTLIEQGIKDINEAKENISRDREIYNKWVESLNRIIEDNNLYFLLGERNSIYDITKDDIEKIDAYLQKSKIELSISTKLKGKLAHLTKMPEEKAQQFIKNAVGDDYLNLINGIENQEINDLFRTIIEYDFNVQGEDDFSIILNTFVDRLQRLNKVSEFKNGYSKVLYEHGKGTSNHLIRNGLKVTGDILKDCDVALIDLDERERRLVLNDPFELARVYFKQLDLNEIFGRARYPGHKKLDIKGRLKAMEKLVIAFRELNIKEYQKINDLNPDILEGLTISNIPNVFFNYYDKDFDFSLDSRIKATLYMAYLSNIDMFRIYGDNYENNSKYRKYTELSHQTTLLTSSIDLASDAVSVSQCTTDEELAETWMDLSQNMHEMKLAYTIIMENQDKLDLMFQYCCNLMGIDPYKVIDKEQDKNIQEKQINLIMMVVGNSIKYISGFHVPLPNERVKIDIEDAILIEGRMLDVNKFLSELPKDKADVLVNIFFDGDSKKNVGDLKDYIVNNFIIDGNSFDDIGLDRISLIRELLSQEEYRNLVKLSIPSTSLRFYEKETVRELNAFFENLPQDKVDEFTRICFGGIEGKEISDVKTRIVRGMINNKNLTDTFSNSELDGISNLLTPDELRELIRVTIPINSRNFYTNNYHYFSYMTKISQSTLKRLQIIPKVGTNYWMEAKRNSRIKLAINNFDNLVSNIDGNVKLSRGILGKEISTSSVPVILVASRYPGEEIDSVDEMTSHYDRYGTLIKTLAEKSINVVQEMIFKQETIAKTM